MTSDREPFTVAPPDPVSLRHHARLRLAAPAPALDMAPDNVFTVASPHPTAPRRWEGLWLAIATVALILGSGAITATAMIAATPGPLPGDPSGHKACNVATEAESDPNGPSYDAVTMIGVASAKSTNVDIRAHGKALYDTFGRAQEEYGFDCGSGWAIDNQIRAPFEEFRGACLNAAYA